MTWISQGFTCVPHPGPPSHLPPHPIPLGLPSAPSPEHLSHASNLDWWSVKRQIFKARTLEWIAIPFSRGSSRPRDWTLVSCIVGRFFTTWAIGESYVYLTTIKKKKEQTASKTNRISQMSEQSRSEIRLGFCAETKVPTSLSIRQESAQKPLGRRTGSSRLACSSLPGEWWRGQPFPLGSEILPA